MDFPFQESESERRRKDGLKNVAEHERDSNTNGNWSPWNSLEEPGKKTGLTGD